MILKKYETKTFESINYLFQGCLNQEMNQISEL